MDQVYSIVLAVGDVCFGWLLALPSDGTIIAIAIITSLVFIAARLVTVNQDLGRRCAADKKRLKQLIKEAKAAGNKEAVLRYRSTFGRIGLKLMKMEGKPTLAALLPVAFLAVWAFERLDFVPPIVQEPIEVSFHYPVSACGRIVHLVPAPGIACEGGWLKRLDREEGDPLSAMAVWKLQFAEAGTHRLAFRFDDKTYEHEVIVGASCYSPTMRFYPENEKIASVVKLSQRRLFGIVPGIESLGCAPWMIGYLLITIPLVFINKALFRVE